MIKLCDVNAEAVTKLPPAFPDKSGIGAHYTDAFIKPMNTKLPDGTRVACKRKGLKITLTVGAKKGEGLMRRLDVSKDPARMLAAALQEAAKAAGAELEIAEGAIWLAPASPAAVHIPEVMPSSSAP
jgi:hydrogenase maturation factor